MAQTPINNIHGLQIQAGVLGRRVGHAFEDTITQKINSFAYPFKPHPCSGSHVYTGDPAALLLSYIGHRECIHKIRNATALSTGALATTEDGRKFLLFNGSSISRCKSDLIITLEDGNGEILNVGVSIKQCNNESPTNAQLYFTTARGFASLLKVNRIAVSKTAITALQQFCGDVGFRPLDHAAGLMNRVVDPRRFFWEEIDSKGRAEWERIFREKQDKVSKLLFQKAYPGDPLPPEYLLHKTRKAPSWPKTEVAIYSIDEIVTLSGLYQGFATKPYSVKKGSHRDPAGITHLAPRFGVIQMQRGGQKQHPDQLQFNLAARYFYKFNNFLA